ncbi:MAG: hypothetical protein JWR05_2472 [Mucilaginibacter sp.]|nr:hypothetical protein [Mucilaginibacter sp.]
MVVSQFKFFLKYFEMQSDLFNFELQSTFTNYKVSIA